MTTSGADLWKDLSITFASDFVSERLVKELGVDAVVALTFDLDFDFATEGLNPKANIVFFAPNVSYKSSAKYFNMDAGTQAKSLSETNTIPGNVVDQLAGMIKYDLFMNEFVQALQKLSAKEDASPVYENLWKAKL